MKRLLTVLLAVPMLGLPTLAGTAAADVVTFTDPRYDSTSIQSIDIVSGSVELTTAQLRVSVQTASGLASDDWVTLDIDTTGDNQPDFMYDPFVSATLNGSALSRPVAPVAGSPLAPRTEPVPCTTSVTAGRGAPTGSGANPAVVTIPATCLGSPASVQVGVKAKWFYNRVPGCIGCGTSTTAEDAAVAPRVAASSAVVTPSPVVTPPVPPRPTPPAPVTPVPTVPLDIGVEVKTIDLGQSSGVGVSGPPGQRVTLYAYTRPSTTYRAVRTGVLNAEGFVVWEVAPPANTRFYAQVGSRRTSTTTINVAQAVAIGATVANGTYRFTGTVRPVAGTPVTLYRKVPGGGIALVGKTTTSASGIWRIDRRFTGAGTFAFYAVTSATANNSAGRSRDYGLAVSPPPRPRPVARPAAPAPSGPPADRDCSDFSSQASAQAFYDRYYDQFGDFANLDGNDNDGVVCESLP